MGQEPCHIDGIGRSQFHRIVEFLVSKSRFYQPLAIIEIAVHFYGRDVLTECRELALLYFAHFAFRVEHVNLDAVYSQKTVCHCAACISRRGNQHVYFAGVVFLADEIRQQPRHEPCPYVLESQGRTVEKFKAVNIVFHLYYRNVETHGIVHDFFQCVFFHVLAEECIRNRVRYFLQAH